MVDLTFTSIAHTHTQTHTRTHTRAHFGFLFAPIDTLKRVPQPVSGFSLGLEIVDRHSQQLGDVRLCLFAFKHKLVCRLPATASLLPGQPGQGHKAVVAPSTVRARARERER